MTNLSHTASFHSNERIAPSNRGIKHLEERLRTLLGEIETDWDSYLYTWDCDRLETQWAEFTVATHTILARAGERMRLEEKVIYPLCFMSGLINMKDAVC
jgi:hypothetical protein